jgi:hypothetical protein
MSSYLTTGTQRVIKLPNDTAMNPAIYMIAVGSELLEPTPELRQNASKDHCNDTTFRSKQKKSLTMRKTTLLS